MAENILDLTLKGLEQALRVEHVATFENLRTCEPSDDVAHVRGREDLVDFDYIPVQDGERISGVWVRPGAPETGLIKDSMRGLTDETLMAASEPLIDFIRSLSSTGFRLVVRRGRVEGIVTRSDIQKLPVRLLVFAVVTHLESLMAEVILHDYPADSWFPLLSPGRQALVRKKHSGLRKERLEVDLIEFTEFTDKFTVLNKAGFTKLEGKGKGKVEKEFQRIRELRDKVAHAATLPESAEDLVERFVDVFERTEFWVEHFEQRINGVQTDRGT